MSRREVAIAVVGATGAVGQAMLEILAERDFPISRLYPLASARSKGDTIRFKDKPLYVEDVAEFDFSQVQLALFSAGGAVSAEYGPIAAGKGCLVIDNTSYFRMEPDVPLVVPEVNPEAVADYVHRNIIANPNCSTIQLVVALKPIYDAVGIERINIATYQAVSGAGRSGVEELATQTAGILSAARSKQKVFPKQIAFNVIPHIDVFLDNGYTKEEMKIVMETRKIFNDPTIQVNPTAVRVPVFYGHAEAVHIETKQKISADAARKLLRQAPGVIVLDDPKKNRYPTQVGEAANHDGVFVGRIREDISHPRGLDLWIVADNVRKGAALNAVQIAEIWLKQM
jgi:aspartate-semialdehyde dehydrogenase